ncbi:MAG: hypothetical protein MR938_05890 [Tenericutes bacterium]|nr:hypothetical protein [Mycoplasmatota bacterium]
MEKKRVVKLGCEKYFAVGMVLLVLASVFLNFVLSASLQSSNSELQRLKTKIESQKKLNLGMKMKIDELSSLDNTMEVADTFGLEYNNSNIRIVK